MLISLFKRTFDIRDGEIRVSFFMQLYIFLIITVLLMVKPTINALFLSELGAEHLPYGYVLVAVIAATTSYYYNRAVKKYSLRIISNASLIFFSLSFLLLSLFMYLDFLNNWILYAYYLSVSLFAVLVTSQFWIFANMVYNAREAKRLFGFIGAGAIAGGIFGGYLTSILAPAFGNKIVMIVAAFFILCCIPILQKVWKMRIRKLSIYIINQRISSDSETYVSPYKLILDSKHLSYLAAIVGVGVIMAKLVDFQFSDFANRQIPDSDDLASFFGFWFSTFNVVALLIQLFLTNRLLSWLGVTTNLLILPLGIAMGCLLFLTFPELWVLVIIKGIDGSFKQSINKAAVELSILPIPHAIKTQAKSYIDIVIDSVATGLAGLLLIFVIRKLDLSTSYVTVIILLVLFVWIFLIYKLREAYFDSFRNNIQTSLESVEEEGGSKRKKKTSIEASINILSSGKEGEILKLLDRLKDYRLKTFQPYIVKLLDHPSSKVKAAAISQLYFYRKGTAVEKIKSLIKVKDDVVVLQAMEYLVDHTHLDDENLFESYLDHPTDYISNAALVCLAKESSENITFAKKYNLSNRIEGKIEELFADDNELRKEEITQLLIAIAYAKNPKYYSFISAQFNNKDPYIVKYAIKAAGISTHEPFINDLMEFLSIETFRNHAGKALKKYGNPIAKKILELETAEALPNDVKPFIPKIIQSIKSRESVKILMRLLQSKDFVIRLEAAKSLNVLKQGNPKLSIDQRLLTRIILRENTYYRNGINIIASLEKVIENYEEDEEKETDFNTDLLIARESLIELLNEQLHQSLECIFKLLSLKYDEGDISTAYFGLKSEARETKINSLEFLDNLLQARLKASVLPLVEYHIIDESERGMSAFQVDIIPEKEALKKLLKNRGAKMKQAVLHVIQYSQDSGYKKLVSNLLNHKNKKVRLLAKDALEAIN